MKDTLFFYSRLAFFSAREEQSSLGATVHSLLLYPCFIWIFSKLWLGLNNNTTSIGNESLFAYIGLTEILFMTAMREPLIDRASSDFSLSFVRPRNWLTYTSITIFSRTFARRLVYLFMYILIMPFFMNSFSPITAMRFLLFLPLVTVLDTLYSLLLTSLQIRFYSTKQFRILFGKLFLIFGGVLAPLSDIPEPWSHLFLNLPFSDLIFQPCYFSIKAVFYELTIFQWFIRVIIQLTCLIALSTWIYQTSRRHYHNFGG